MTTLCSRWLLGYMQKHSSILMSGQHFSAQVMPLKDRSTTNRESILTLVLSTFFQLGLDSYTSVKLVWRLIIMMNTNTKLMASIMSDNLIIRYIIPTYNYYLLTMFKNITRVCVALSLLGAPPVFLATNNKTTRTTTYIWGNGVYQARPDAILKFQNFTPKKITTFSGDKSLKLLRFGEHFEAGIDVKDQLYVWPVGSIDSSQSRPSDHTRQGLKLLEKNIKDVRFTKDFIWALTNSGDIYQWKLHKTFDQEGNVTKVEIQAKRHIAPLKEIAEFSTGYDHFVALNKKGQVYAMGCDTEGQIGQAEQGRSTSPPFPQRRVTVPSKVNLPKIRRIVCGTNHTLAIDQNGALYGWGSNSNMQLSQQQAFSKVASPLIIVPSPLQISKNLANNQVVQVAAGDQFTIISTKNKQNGQFQTFGVGCNLNGQLGHGQVFHLKDVSKIDSLSNYVDSSGTNVQIEQIQCGKNHCITRLNSHNAILEWGDNQFGQMGNKKRSRIDKPVVISEFLDKKIIGVFAGENSSGVIVEEQAEKTKKA